MEEIHKLRGQISNIVQSNFPEIKTPFSPSLPPPDSKQVCVHGASAWKCVERRFIITAQDPAAAVNGRVH